MSVGYIMFIAMTFFMVGALLLATMPVNQTYWVSIPDAHFYFVQCSHLLQQAQTFVSVLIMPGAMNLSYPAANILMSSALPKEKQGIAASLVSTLVNYSISCGLGFAGTIDRYVIDIAARKQGWVPADGNPVPLSDHSPRTAAIRLTGARAVFYFAAGLGGLGMFIASIHILMAKRRPKAMN